MRSRWPFAAMLLLASLALALSACGDDDNGGEAAPTATQGADGQVEDGAADGGDADVLRDSAPCRLLTEDEARQILGQELQVVDDSIPGACRWVAEDNATLAVVISDLGEPTLADQTFEGLRGGLGGEPVEGIGDDALWVDDFGTLYIRLGATELGVTVLFLDDPADARELALAAAEKALDGR